MCHREKVLSIEPPPGDEELKHIVEPAYLYEGKTEFVLEGNTMTVTIYVNSKVLAMKINELLAWNIPPNGVIYVSGGCGQKFTRLFGPIPRYSRQQSGRTVTDTTCGNVYVHGEYKKSLTIAAENDVVINGNLTTPVNGEDAHD